MIVKRTVFFLLTVLFPMALESKDPEKLREVEVIPVNDESDVDSLQDEIKEKVGAIQQLLSEVSTLAESCRGCPAGWSPHKGSCYHMVSTTSKTFSEAQEKCKDLGADLVIIKSAEENDFISDLLKKKGRNWAWLGLRRKPPGLKFYWVDGTPIEGKYDSWAPGEPNNSGGKEHCAYTDRSAGRWNDFPCERTSTPGPSVVCQK